MTIRVEQGKGAKDRYTLLPPRLLKELRRYWIAQRPALWLFPSPRVADHPTNPHSAQRIFYAAKDRAGITKQCGIHGLRHAFATHLLEAGGERAHDSAPARTRLSLHHGALLPPRAKALVGRHLAPRPAGAG